MQFNYDFYVAAMAVLTALIAYHIGMAREDSLASRMYGFLLVLCFLCCATDMFSGAFLMQRLKEQVALNYIGQIVAFCTQHLMPVVYFLYMMVLGRELEQIPRKAYLWCIPAVIVQLLIFTTPLTGLVFTYTAQDGYRRGPAILFLIIVAIFYMLYASLQLFFSRKEGGGRYLFISAVFFGLAAVCLVIQLMGNTYMLLGAGCALACLVMQLVLQNPKMIQEANEKEVEARKAAVEANQAKSTFLANMSHEIRTPMNAICGVAEILEKGQLDKIEREYVHTIQQASQSLLGIIDDILDFSKIDAGKLELVPAEYELEELLTGVEDIIAARLQNKDIRFEISIAGDEIPQTLKGDSGKVHQILINILGNAVKFTERGKIALDITFHPIGGGRAMVEFLVSDTGIGIRQEDMDKLFGQFSQVDTMRNRKVEGTGLGLTLSKRLANLMGGDVTVTSEYGVGSCFKIDVIQEIISYTEKIDTEKLKQYQAYIYEQNYEARWYLSRILSQIGISTIFLNDVGQLNALKTKEITQEKPVLFYSYESSYQKVEKAKVPFQTVALIEYYTVANPEQPIRYYLRKPFDIFKLRRVLFEQDSEEETPAQEDLVQFKDTRVAIVDDNKVNLKVTATLLREFKVMPETFASGEGILKAIQNGREYDIIFMDHMMPEMDGVEATQRIRKMDTRFTRNVTIIALTANAINGVEKEYAAAGMDDWLFKPVNSKQLVQKLLKYLPEDKVVHLDA